jgi:drug/metabolite transporter (DMT)-like permease
MALWRRTRSGIAAVHRTMTPAAALVALHVAVALFGFAGLFGKWLAWDPVAIVLGRTIVAAAVLGLISVIRPSERGGPTLALAGNGVILAVHWVAFFAAIQKSTVAIGLLGFASFPLFVIVLECVLLGVRWRGPEAATATLVVAGLALLVPEFTLADRTVHGLAWGVLSAFTFAWLTVRNRALGNARPPMAVALWQNAFAALCVAPLVFRSGGPAVAITPTTLALIVVLGAVCTALAHTLFIASLSRLSAHTASVVTSLESVYGIVLAALLLAEIPDARTCFGGALLVGAAIAASRRAARPADP